MCFQIRHDENLPFHEPKAFDAEHERRRKEQLNRLFSRTPEQVSGWLEKPIICYEITLTYRCHWPYLQIEEEQMLTQELRKIEARKKEREKKTQDLQKLITGNDSPAEPRKQERRPAQKKRFQNQVRVRSDPNVSENVRIYETNITRFVTGYMKLIRLKLVVRCLKVINLSGMICSCKNQWDDLFSLRGETSTISWSVGMFAVRKLSSGFYFIVVEGWLEIIS